MAGVGLVTSATAPAYIAAHVEGACKQRTSSTEGQTEKFLTLENCEGQREITPRKNTYEHKEALGNVVGTGGVTRLATTIAKKTITITCKKATGNGSLKEEGKSKGTATYEDCSLEGISGCTVPNITARALGRLVESGGATAGESYEEGSGFATVVIEVCALKGSYKITGTQICKLPKGEEFAVVHKTECTTAGSSLKLGSEKATFEGTATGELESKEKWAVEAT